MDDDFEDAKRKFDSETHESLTRDRIEDKDALKMMKPWRMLLACMMLGMTN